MQNTEQSCSSAGLLLKVGDIRGACNRAYYAMFNAARAALLFSDAPVKSDITKTHRGLIAALRCLPFVESMRQRFGRILTLFTRCLLDKSTQAIVKL